jgi:6-phosphogluconolactonase
MARLTIVRDKSELSTVAAGRIASLIQQAIARRQEAAICLAGGGTPDGVYEALADPVRPWRGRIDWTHVHLFWGDERNVPPNHPESNFGLVNRTLIQRVDIPESNIHRIRGELAAVDAGREYDAILRTRRAQIDHALFDVTLLGIGANAHIASLFPVSPLLHEYRFRAATASTAPQTGCGDSPLLAAGVWIPELNQWRITLTPAALLDSDAIIVIATGSEKAVAVAAAIQGPEDVLGYPAQLLRDTGDRVEWIVDEAAAGKLSSSI